MRNDITSGQGQKGSPRVERGGGREGRGVPGVTEAAGDAPGGYSGVALAVPFSHLPRWSKPGWEAAPGLLHRGGGGGTSAPYPGGFSPLRSLALPPVMRK